MKKLLIIGAAGQLGTELQRQLQNGECALGALPAALKEAEVVLADVNQLDITNRANTMAFLAQEQPSAVINCAAFTNVNACEDHQQAAFAVNALGARNLAMACEAVGAKLLHVSTDYVFAGEGTTTPYSEYDQPRPQSVYGATKWAGEEYVRTLCSRFFIVRTAWLYGKDGSNFVKTILRAAKKNGVVTVVADQLGNPTNAEDLAFHLLRLCCTEEYGIYHATCEGVCSWYDFTKEIIRLAKIPAQVNPCTTAEYPTPAKRPAFSALENRMLAATIGNDMRPWQVALAGFFKEFKMED